MPLDNSIIAIDGPAGSGKSTVAKLVAKRISFAYIDTGAMYRALTLKAKLLNLNPKNEKSILELMKKTEIKIQYNNDKLVVLLDGKDVSDDIRKPFISNGVSQIAKIKSVRVLMTNLQREFARNNNSVLEGRDIGTVVFPDAKYKFFLDADFKERARRRFKELKEKNEDISLKLVEEDVSSRDRIDSTRKFAPLKKAKDAICIDTTDLSIEEVANKILSCIKN